MAENKIGDLKKFLSTPDRPVSMEEMQEFWNSLTDEEKADFKQLLAERLQREAELGFKMLDDMTPEQRKKNLRMGLILASVAVVFFVGFLAKIMLLNR